MRLKSYVLIFLFLFSGVVYYYLASDDFQRDFVFVSRVIDGDTFETDNGIKARLLGINAPEKGRDYSDNATYFLRQRIENKTVEIFNFGTDKYGRFLVYVFLNGNVNEEVLVRGLGTLYYYEKDKFYSDLNEAELNARLNGIGLWKLSENSECVSLVSLRYEEPEKLVLNNSCGFDIPVLIKDDATHIYEETLKKGLFEKNFSHIFNDEGDSLYVRDKKGLLVFYRY